MLILLQSSQSPAHSPLDRIPTFSDLISTYGAFLTVVLVAVVAICWLQYVWFKRIVNSKDEQIKRMDEKERDLFNRLTEFMDKKKNKQ